MTDSGASRAEQLAERLEATIAAIRTGRNVAVNSTVSDQNDLPRWREFIAALDDVEELVPQALSVVAALEAERAALREALEPFARTTATSGYYNEDGLMSFDVTPADVEQARAALRD